MGADRQLVIFDCDGVLVDSEYLITSIESDMLAPLGVVLTAQEVADTFTGLSETDMTRLILERWGVTLAEDFHVEKRRQVTVAMTESLEPVADIETVIEHLAQPSCVASSSGLDRIELALTITGLWKWFDGRIFSSSQVARGKPAPDLFLLAAAAMGVPADACVVVEDSPYGVQAGVAAGMEVIGLTAARHCGPSLGQRLRAAGAHHVAPTTATLAELLA